MTDARVEEADGPVDHMTPDPHVVWAFVVFVPGSEKSVYGVHYDRNIAEWHSSRVENSEIRRKRLWFSNEELEREIDIVTEQHDRETEIEL